MSAKYECPDFIKASIEDPAKYINWLSRKAQAHARRDRKRGNTESELISKIKMAIHKAILECAGQDAYTGEDLEWHRISEYDNTQAKEKRRLYKKDFALLPTVDHLGDGTGEPEFKICAWRTNDAKNDLSEDEFVALCKKVLEHKGYSVTGP